jgi:hypothetical protein
VRTATKRVLAGFTIVRPRRKEPLPRSTNVLPAYDVLAELKLATDKPAARMNARAVLRPRIIMDYGVVGDVFGRMSKEPQ